MKQAALWNYEIEYQGQGFPIVGLDEVGRGAWAGPIVAAAYTFSMAPCEVVLYDSKIMTERQRDTAAQTLKTLGHYGIGEASNEEIDAHGLQAAQYLAYQRALDQLPWQPKIIFLDGRPWRECPYKHRAIIGGDSRVASIAAAAILAKVYRDKHMKDQVHKQYPDYGFNVHVGYGTKLHQSALARFGVTPIHRMSYKPVARALPF